MFKKLKNESIHTIFKKKPNAHERKMFVKSVLTNAVHHAAKLDVMNNEQKKSELERDMD
jgi:hypothetical protein